MKLNKNKIITAHVKQLAPSNVSESVSEVKLFIKETEEEFEDKGYTCNDYGVLFAPGPSVVDRMICVFNLFDDNSGLLILLISTNDDTAPFNMTEFNKFKKQLLEELS